MHTTHFVTNDPIGEDVLNTGLQTAYHDVGEGEVLLLVHGFTGSKLDFQDHISLLAQTHRVIAYDHRGHGESSNIGPYNLYGLAADLIGLLDKLSIRQCHVLGHSLGGMVVLRALLSYPGRFSSALLMDTAPHAVQLFDTKVLGHLNTVVTNEGCQGLLKGMQGQPQNAVIQRGIDFLGEQEHWRRIRVKLEQMDPQAFIELAEVLADQPSVLTSLDNVDIPVTIICGEHDAPFVKPSQKMAALLPNSLLAMIPQAGHSPQYEHAREWLETVQAHLHRAAS